MILTSWDTADILKNYDDYYECDEETVEVQISARRRPWPLSLTGENYVKANA